MFEKLNRTGKGDILFGQVGVAEIRLRNPSSMGAYVALTDRVRLVPATIRLRNALVFGPGAFVNRFAPVFNPQPLLDPRKGTPLYV